MRSRLLLSATLIIFVVSTLFLQFASFSARAQDGDDDPTVDFEVSEEYLKFLSNGGTIQPSFRVRMEERSGSVHTLSGDCELHIAGSPVGLKLGDPADVVTEPINLCKRVPLGSTGQPSEKKLREVIWPNLFDQKVMNKTCDVVGFPRIFTEHASTGTAGGANPNHVFEIHPATSITCGGQPISFQPFIVALPGMRAVKPTTAQSCIEKRKLDVRFRNGAYEFKEQGGQCGNFAIVEVAKLKPEWIRGTTGGHSAIARISADGQSRTTLKIYTLAPSEADQWLAKVMTQGTGNKRKLVHGLFTYDYFSILKVIRKADGSFKKPQAWTEVSFPVALVLLGETKTVPWTEE
jgi:hypothetical protein